MVETLKQARTPRLIGVIAVSLVLIAMAACKTTEGAGKDIENLGDNIQDAAD